MNKTIRVPSALAAILLLSGAAGFAQSGEAVYKSKCAMCHGALGMPNPGIAKNMGVRPIGDPAVKAESAAQMIAITASGKAKMPAFKSKLSEAEIKAAVEYFRSLVR